MLYSNYTQIVTLASSGIRSLPDLKGKTISTGAPGSGTEIVAFRLLEAAGLNRDTDVRRQGLGVAQSVDAIKDGKLHAFFWSGGLPTASILDLTHTPGIKIQMLPKADALIASLQRTYGQTLYYALTIPASVLGPRRRRSRRWCGQCARRASAAMPDALAFDITACCSSTRPNWKPFTRKRETSNCRRPRRAPRTLPSRSRTLLPAAAGVDGRAGRDGLHPLTGRTVFSGRRYSASRVRIGESAGGGAISRGRARGRALALRALLGRWRDSTARCTMSFLLGALVLTFLHYPARHGSQSRLSVLDGLLVGAVDRRFWSWSLLDVSRFVYRAASPTTSDLACGAIVVVLVLEATRRTVGWILPCTALTFLAYASARSAARSRWDRAARDIAATTRIA